MAQGLRHLEYGPRCTSTASCWFVQLFQKVAPLRELAPTQSEPPFQIAQLSLLVLFIALGVRATAKFGRASVRSASVGG